MRHHSHVDSDNYQDNASPCFLVNPFTRENGVGPLYHGGVAFEFNGPQHTNRRSLPRHRMWKSNELVTISRPDLPGSGIPLSDPSRRPDPETMIRKVGTYSSTHRAKCAP